MKFEIMCEDFKKAVDKALVVAPKKSSFVSLERIIIEAKDNMLYLSASDADSFVTIKVEANVYEEGYVLIHRDDIQKLYNIKGWVDVETREEDDGEKIVLSVYNSRKNISATTVNIDKEEFPKIGEQKDKLFMTMRRNYLIETLKGLSVFLGEKIRGERNLMSGFFFDGVNERIVSLDSHRIGIRKLLPNTINNKKSTAVIPGDIFKHLKKIIDIKSDKNVEIYLSKNRAYFESEDFSYSIRLLEGTYFDIDRCFNWISNKIEACLDTKEVRENTTEYYKLIKGKDEGHPMIVGHKDNKLYMGINYNSILMFDQFETKLNCNDFIAAFKPKYFNDIAKVIVSDKMKILFESEHTYKNPIAIADDNDDWSFLLLPVNPPEHAFDNFVKMIDEREKKVA